MGAQTVLGYKTHAISAPTRISGFKISATSLTCKRAASPLRGSDLDGATPDTNVLTAAEGETVLSGQGYGIITFTGSGYFSGRVAPFTARCTAGNFRSGKATRLRTRPLQMRTRGRGAIRRFR